MDNIKLKDIYDEVAMCKKCGREYGYDIPNKLKKKFCGRTKIIPGYTDNGSCPMCDKSFKEKPKGLYASNY